VELSEQYVDGRLRRDQLVKKILSICAAFAVAGAVALAQMTAPEPLLAMQRIFGLTANPASFVPAGSAFITGRTGGALMNDYTGPIGMEITCMQACHIVALGRFCVTGNNATHSLMVKGSGTIQAGQCLSVNAALGTPGTWQYAYYTTPLPLTNGDTYFVLSQEANGSDQWYDVSGTVTPAVTSAIELDGAEVCSGSCADIGAVGNSPGELDYGPVNFLFTVP
jgi:hypothetical protein